MMQGGSSKAVIVEDESGDIINPSTEDTLDKLLFSIRRLIDAQILNPTIDMASYRNRVTAILEAGTAAIGSVTIASGTISSVGTTNIPQAQDMVLGANLTAWAMCCRERIS
jgi:hypothetical protein